MIISGIRLTHRWQHKVVSPHRTPTTQVDRTDVCVVSPEVAAPSARENSRWRRLAACISWSVIAVSGSIVPAMAQSVSTTAMSAASPSQTAVVSGRQGTVLSAGRILAADQYAGMHRDAMQTKFKQPRIEGAPNFRGLAGDPVFGLSQPTAQGIRGVLTQLGAQPGGSGQTVHWTDLRGEPVVFIDGVPFSPREATTPIENLAASADPEATEQRLKQDIMAEASRYGGKILLHEQTADGKMTSRWVSPQSVQTTAEVFDSLRQEGYRVDMLRVPLTDHVAPQPQQMDILSQRARAVDPNSPMVFNCAHGNGRTTTGMVVADLTRQAVKGNVLSSVLRSPAVHEDVRMSGDYDPSNYRPIVALVKSLENGAQAKVEADTTIDSANAMTNLRQAVGQNPDNLRRYFYVVAYQSYLRQEAPLGFPQSFSQWGAQHGLESFLQDSK